jgi:regulator of protease activity HflC (stomatin/prohibitin superfamily)
LIKIHYFSITFDSKFKSSNKTSNKMILIILGLILYFFSRNADRDIRTSKFGSPAKYIGFLLILIGILSSMVKQVEAGSVGVQKLFGKVEDGILESGLSLVNPLVEVVTINTKTQNYTMSGVHDEGDKEGDDAIRVLSSDGLEVIIDVTVLYKVNPASAPKIVREIGSNYQDVIVRPMVRTRLRDNAVYYEAIALYSTKRDEFQNRIFETIKKDFTSRGLELESVLVRNIVLPSSVKTTIESKINAEQEAQKMQFVLQKEKQEAERKRVEAQGIADYQRIISTGLSDKQLQYEMTKANKEIATSSNAKIIILGDAKGVPLFLGDK